MDQIIFDGHLNVWLCSQLFIPNVKTKQKVVIFTNQNKIISLKMTVEVHCGAQLFPRSLNHPAEMKGSSVWAQ